MLKLKEYLSLADKLYSSVDLRSILIYDNEEWKNIFTLIKFSIYSCEEVSKEQEILMTKLGKINNDKIKISMKTIEIKKFEELTTQINGKFLYIDGIKSNFICKEFILDDLTVNKVYRYYLGELSEYPSFHASVRDNKNELSLYRSKLTNLLIVFGFTDVNGIFPSYFGIETFSFQDNVTFSFPIHCNIINMILHNNYELEINIKISDNLIGDSTIWLNRIVKTSNQDRIIERDEHYARNCVSSVEGKFGYLKINQKYDGLKYNEIIEVIISNQKLGIVSDKQLYIQFESNKKNKFIQAFNLFDSRFTLEKNLIDANNANLFEISVAWIFELLNLRTMYLGKTGERIRDNSSQVGSADILIYNEASNFIYAIDCTVMPPSADKIDRIRNTSLYLARKLGSNVRPFIVCSVYCSNVKKAATELGVSIIDKEDLQKMIELIKAPYETPWELSKIIMDDIPTRVRTL